jgi:hypothetical protein
MLKHVVEPLVLKGLRGGVKLRTEVVKKKKKLISNSNSNYIRFVFKANRLLESCS